MHEFILLFVLTNLLKIYCKPVYEQRSNLKSGSCVTFKLSEILCPSIKNVSESVKNLCLVETIASCIQSYFDNVITQFMINNRTDTRKTDIDLLN